MTWEGGQRFQFSVLNWNARKDFHFGESFASDVIQLGSTGPLKPERIRDVGGAPPALAGYFFFFLVTTCILLVNHCKINSPCKCFCCLWQHSNNSPGMLGDRVSLKTAARPVFSDFYLSSCFYLKRCQTENIKHSGDVLNLHLHPAFPSKYMCVYVCVCKHTHTHAYKHSYLHV